MLVYMSSNSSRHSLDFKRAEKEQQRGFKMPLWRLTLLTFVSTGSLWAAQHALSRLVWWGKTHRTFCGARLCSLQSSLSLWSLRTCLQSGKTPSGKTHLSI